MVWFAIADKSAVSFDSLKENTLMVYPSSAKQYLSGAWADKTAKIYQAGAWVDWWNGELFAYGNEFAFFTGGWNNLAIGMSSGDGAGSNLLTKTVNADGSWTLTSASLKNGVLHTVNKIDLTNYSKLCFEGYIYEHAYGYCQMAIWTDMGSYSSTNRVASVTKSTNDYAEINIANLSGLHYIGFSVYNNNAGITMRKVWLE